MERAMESTMLRVLAENPSSLHAWSSSLIAISAGVSSTRSMGRGRDSWAFTWSTLVPGGPLRSRTGTGGTSMWMSQRSKYFRCLLQCFLMVAGEQSHGRVGWR